MSIYTRDFLSPARWNLSGLPPIVQGLTWILWCYTSGLRKRERITKPGSVRWSCRSSPGVILSQGGVPVVCWTDKVGFSPAESNKGLLLSEGQWCVRCGYCCLYYGGNLRVWMCSLPWWSGEPLDPWVLSLHLGEGAPLSCVIIHTGVREERGKNHSHILVILLHSEQFPYLSFWSRYFHSMPVFFVVYFLSQH